MKKPSLEAHRKVGPVKWSGPGRERLNKMNAYIVELLFENGPMGVGEVCEIVGTNTRPRDLKRRGLSRLVAYGLVEERGGTLFLVDGWEDRLKDLKREDRA